MFASDSPADSGGTDAAAELLASAGLSGLDRKRAETESNETYDRITKTPFNKRQLDKFRRILLDKRAQILGDVEGMENEALRRGGSGALSHLPQHMADAGSDTYDQTLNLDLSAAGRRMLKDIDDAIARVDNRTFGVCEKLGKPISEERLEMAPWARYSIEAQRQFEQMGGAG